ncbi:hypothetical protein SAMD00019534_001520, partial [Acytostelium subglobosum LB1]|uniref:hypothetical protein n=1 Tax=Acytostelium subglobosum LB1 TaxID=1410327 RepID=UPI000644890C
MSVWPLRHTWSAMCIRLLLRLHLHGVCGRHLPQEARRTVPEGQYQWCAGSGTPTAQCAPRRGINESCEDHLYQDQCQIGLVCTYVDSTMTNRTCVPLSSKPEGSACVEPELDLTLNGRIPHIECDMSKGLKCIKGTCQKSLPLPSGPADCSTALSCDYQRCQCPTVNSTIGYCDYIYNYDLACANSIQDLVKCALKYKCQTTAQYYSPMSCLYRHCSDVICNNKCSTSRIKISTCGPSEEVLYPTCNLLIAPTDDDLPSVGAIQIPSSLIVLFMSTIIS